MAIPPLNDYIARQLSVDARRFMEDGNRPMFHCLQRAVKAIKAHDATIRTGNEAQQIKHIGPSTASKIDAIIGEWERKFGTSSSTAPTSADVPPPSHSVSVAPIQPVSMLPAPPETVTAWFDEIGLSSYCKPLMELGYDNFDVCEELTEDDLSLVAELQKKPGHRKTLLLRSRELKQRRITPPIISNSHSNSNSNSTSTGFHHHIYSNIHFTSDPSVCWPVITEEFILANSLDSSCNKALDLLSENAIQSIDFTTPQKITSKMLSADGRFHRENNEIISNENDFYEIQLRLKENKVHSVDCNCEYAGTGWN